MMKKIMGRTALFVCIIWITSSLAYASLTINVKRRHRTEALPSLSGIEYHNGYYYAICDDTPWIYRMDKALRVTEKIELKSYQLENGRIPKSLFKISGMCYQVAFSRRYNDTFISERH